MTSNWTGRFHGASRDGPAFDDVIRYGRESQPLAGDPPRLEPFWRDASDRLTFGASGLTGGDYADVCRDVADAFGLTPISEATVGPEQMFQDFRRNDCVVGLEWDIWLGYVVVAQTPESEPLVRDIAAWMDANRHPG